MLKKGCTIAVVLLGGTFAGYWVLLRGKVEFPGDLVLALLGSVGLLMLVSTLKQVIFGDGNAVPLRRAEQGLPLEDGKREAAWGPIVPLGGVLAAPFSGVPCVAYEYDAKKPPTTDSDGESSSSGSAISGLALAPSVIRSPRGDVKLFGFSPLSAFPGQDLSGDAEARRRALDYLARTRFDESGAAKVASLLAQMDEVLADDDGTVRKDWRFSGAGAADVAGAMLEEKVVAPNEVVTAIGIWDASRGALVPEHAGSSTIVTLAPGGRSVMMATAKKRPWGLLAFALLWAGAIHAAIAVVLLSGK